MKGYYDRHLSWVAPRQKKEIKPLFDFNHDNIDVLINNTVLTTGTDLPPCDVIVLLRATMSPVLYVQMLGRGMRLYPSKKDCLVFDFGQNISRHGPIEEIKGKPENKSKKGGAGAPVKLCSKCDTPNAIANLECSVCGHPFPETSTKTFEKTVDEGDVMFRSPVNVVKVDDVFYSEHLSQRSGKTTFCVTYKTGMNQQREYFGVDTSPAAKAVFSLWWERRWPEGINDGFVPDTISKALKVSKVLKKPEAIEITTEGKYTNVTGYIFAKEPNQD